MTDRFTEWFQRHARRFCAQRSEPGLRIKVSILCDPKRTSLRAGAMRLSPIADRVEWSIFPVLHSCYFPADSICVSYEPPENHEEVRVMASASKPPFPIACPQSLVPKG